MKRRYFWLGTLVVAAIVAATITAEPGRVADRAMAQGPTPTPTNCVECSVPVRDCPDTPEYCVLGNCSYVFTLSCSTPSCPGAASEFQVHLYNVEYCDACVDLWSMTARFYGAHGYIGGGELSPGSYGSYYCLDEMPTSVVVVWDGDYNCNYYTGGVKNLQADICCIDC